MNEHIAESVNNVMSLTSTITTLNNLYDRIASGMTQKERDTFIGAINMFETARASWLQRIGISLADINDEDMGEDEGTSQEIQVTESKEKPQPQARATKVPPQKTPAKTQQQSPKKDTSEYPE